MGWSLSSTPNIKYQSSASVLVFLFFPFHRFLPFPTPPLEHIFYYAMMAQDTYPTSSYLSPPSSLLQQQQYPPHNHYTKETPKQHGSQSIPALLNNDNDEQEYLPTPVTPAVAFSSILPISDPSLLKNSSSTASKNADCSPENNIAPTTVSPSTHGAGYASPPHHRPFSPRALPIATDVILPGEVPGSSAAPRSPPLSNTATITTAPAPAAPAMGHRKGHNHPGGTTEKLFACDKCDQTFSRQHNLKSHLATHSSEKPFQCDVCALNFRRLHDLKRHKKLHTGVRPYVCKDCSRSFARLDALNRHQRADGGNGCSVLHSARKTGGIGSNNNNNKISYSNNNSSNENNTSTTVAPSSSSHSSNHHRGALTPRRPIPQLHIAHPASQPLAASDQHHSRPTYTTRTPAPGSATTPSIVASPPPHQMTQQQQQQPSAFRLPPLQAPTPTSPPPPPTSSAWERLELENRALKAQIIQLKAQCEQKEDLKSKIHDLQIENKVLRSLIMDAQRLEPEDQPATKRSRHIS